MKSKLFYNTVTPQLLQSLNLLMGAQSLHKFRLVGGTALSLYRGHRISVDIDMFTDAAYGTVDFRAIGAFLEEKFPYVDNSKIDIVGIGRSFFVGDNPQACIKVDFYYTDHFIQDAYCIDGLRMATIDEIVAMKMDVIARGGRKKDFWDLHELMGDYAFEQMLNLHQERYPYTHDRPLLIQNFSHFLQADDDFDPVCLQHKYWELIKKDMVAFSKIN
jgi:hypothetical protein